MADDSGVGALRTLAAHLDRPPVGRPIVTLRESPDFFWPPWWEPEQIAAVEDEYVKLDRAAVAELGAAWGEPDLSARRGRRGSPWCTGEEVSGWRRGGRRACVWWGHEDKELPVVLEVGVVPPEWEA